MLEYDTSLLEKKCKWIINALGKSLKWKWDERFETILAEFSIQDTDKIKDLLLNQMDIVWDVENQEDAPDIIHIIIDYFGGLNANQQLFTSDPVVDGILLCAWWPWGNQETISIRLAVFADSLTDDENDELTRIFKNWFGV